MAEAMQGVVTLFASAIQAFEFIQVARALESDAAIYKARLAIIQLRLSRWGAAVGIAVRQDDEPDNQQIQDTLSSTAVAEAVEDTLYNIKKILKAAQAESAKLKPSEDEMMLDNEEDFEPRYNRLIKKAHSIVSKRCKGLQSNVQQVKWALYKKEQSEAFTKQLSELMDELDKTVDPESKLDDLSRIEFKVLRESLKTLVEAVGAVDPRLNACATQTLEDEEETRSFSNSATNNYGIQMGVNRGEMKGLTFGTGNTVTHTWQQN